LSVLISEGSLTWMHLIARTLSPSNIPGHPREPADDPLGQKSGQKADEHDGELPALGIIRGYDPGGEDQVGHISEDHGQNGYGHIPQPLVSRGQAIAAQVVRHAGQYLGGGAQAGEESGPERHAQNFDA